MIYELVAQEGDEDVSESVNFWRFASKFVTNAAS